ncbi:tRNA-splicing endonuclease subunit Sen54 [Nephila pilipes]|uniref:tRNA-splicing endonuclease subunit Sen54 n=1 Tax=Nephila pilipes TaxID=299642 RepID=A0A8X6ULW4_NEPPI|nr:tRNA-splicing endonuclease subunit Sen54 [Nephila pilipes]
MENDGTSEASVSDVNKTFLSAAELVSLRKSTEESTRPVIGNKLYTRSESHLDNEALECALETYECILNKKRAGRICDVMQAEWNPELNAVVVSKLKGKFVQHMGRMVNGKHVLSPEEAVFLLENGCIEIINGDYPMSTEEAYNVILKGHLGLEKYQVYSHLSQLGFIVVPHQTQLGIAQYEKEINLNKYPLKKRRGEETVGEPEKKRLTFTGAFSVESDLDISSSTSQGNSTAVTINEAVAINAVESCEKTEYSCSNKHIDVRNDGERLMDSHSTKINVNEVSIEHTVEDIYSETTEINHASLSPCQNVAELQNIDHETSKEINVVSDSNLLSGNSNQAEFQVKEDAQTSGINTQLNLDESTQNTEQQVRQECVDVNSQSSAAQSSKDVDIMDVETDADVSETSRDNFNSFNSGINATSQDSYCAVINNDVRVMSGAEDVNSGSNFDVVSCSSDGSEDDEVLTLNGEANDDEVTLIEVTKKETKPLAVIELLSDEDDKEEVAMCDDDDEITVIDEYPGPSSTRATNSRVNIDCKLYDCKKVKQASHSNEKIEIPYIVDYPDIFRKNQLCIRPPPSQFLPSHVRLSKEAYVLIMKNKSEQPRRVWNSFRDVQEHQRNRRNSRYTGQNVPRFINWQSRLHRFPQTFESYQNNPFGPTLNSDNTYARDFNRPMHQQVDHRNNFSFPEAAPVHSVVSYRQQNMNVSMTGNPNMSMPFPNNSTFSNPLLTGGSNSNQFMAEVQRTAYTLATNMVSTMLGNNMNRHMMPNLHVPPMLTSVFNPDGSFNSNGYNGLNSYRNHQNNNNHSIMPNDQRNSSNQLLRFHRGRPFPCRYGNIRSKRTWDDIKSAVCESNSDSEIEEVPLTPTEILWDSKGVCPLVKPGTRYPIATVFKFLQVTQKAKVTNKYCYNKRLLPNESSLEISFDVYLPGFSYKKTKPDIPKHRIVVVRSTDPIPKYSDIVVLQRKWNDSAVLQLAVVDNGDISFHSFNSISLPPLIPHQ